MTISRRPPPSCERGMRHEPPRNRPRVCYGRLMTLRHPLLLAASLIMLATAAGAQQRPPSREDLLDALTRHIQICSELTDGPARLACYDKLQTQVGDVQAPARTPTPLANNPPPAPVPLPPSGGGQL